MYLVRSQAIPVFKNKIWLRLSILLLIIVGLALVAYAYGLIPLSVQETRLLQARLLHFLNSLGPVAFIGFILLQAAQVVIAPIPGEVTGLLGGVLYGTFIGVILSTIGLTLGSYIAFALSRTFGRPFVEKFVDGKTIGRFDYLLHHKGVFLVFLLFLIPGVPKDFLCYILGLGHLSTTEFLVISSTGRLLGTILLTLGGTYIRQHQYYNFSVLLGIAIVIVLISMAYKDKFENLFQKWHASTHKVSSKVKDK